MGKKDIYNNKKPMNIIVTLPKQIYQTITRKIYISICR